MKIPIRSMIHAKKDHLLLNCDLSQAEAWVTAYASNESKMKVALRSGRLHETTAIFVLELTEEPTEEQRYVGKKCNHAFNYKMGPDRAAEVINKEGFITVSYKQTKKFHQKYLELYPGLKGWWFEIEEKLRLERMLKNYYGFRRIFHQGIGHELTKEGIAFIPQSTIADHTYGAIQPELGIAGGLKVVKEKISSEEIRIIQSAHDSCLIEFPKQIDVKDLFSQVKVIMERPMIINGEEFTIPCDGKYGEAWEEFEKIKLAA